MQKSTPEGHSDDFFHPLKDSATLAGGRIFNNRVTRLNVATP
ncbi:MAG: hypothetical protein ACXWVS_08055 [Hyphomicrobium sp.]